MGGTGLGTILVLGSKETWALITWLIYAVYLHLYRSREWRGNHARWMVIAGFLLVMFTFSESIICCRDCTATLEAVPYCCSYFHKYTSMNGYGTIINEKAVTVPTVLNYL